jgi:hypothetical protein
MEIEVERISNLTSDLRSGLVLLKLLEILLNM